MSDFFIGIDCGTQSTKCLVLNEETGNIIGQGSAAHEILRQRPGMKEQDPEVWIKACRLSIHQAVKSAGILPGRIRAIGVSGQQHGFVPLDRAGKAIRPAKLWCDTETASQNSELIEKLGGQDNVIKLIGQPLAVGYTASKILWLKQNEPDNYNRLARILLPHEYINYWLTGEIFSEFGDASGTGYLNTRLRQWQDEVLMAIDDKKNLKECMPELIQSHEIIGKLKNSIADELGLNNKILVSAGGGDNMMAAIGTGAVQEGVVTASLGTSGTLFCYSNGPIQDPAGDIAGFCSSSGGWLPLICTMNVTVATELMRNLFSLNINKINQLAEDAKAGSGGLVLIPFFDGERTPAVPNATASLLGMTSQNMDSRYFVRAAMEGASMGLRYGLEAFIRNHLAPREIRLVGGGAKSSVWCQIISDMFQRRCVRLKISEAAALGAALQAVWAYRSHIGHKSNIVEITDEFVQIDGNAVFKPDSATVLLYDKLYDHYKNLCKSLLSTYGKQRELINSLS
ncbi:MAG: xylulokinase [bacterium]